VPARKNRRDPASDESDSKDNDTRGFHHTSLSTMTDMAVTDMAFTEMVLAIWKLPAVIADLTS
jgi:hypothetical protein